MSALLRAYNDRSPYGVWAMDELSGTVMRDSSVNGRHGTYVNAPGLGADGPLGQKAAEFTAGNDHATVALNLSAFTAVTVCYWLYKAAFVNTDALALEFGDPAGPNFYDDPDDSAGTWSLITQASGASWWGSRFTRPSTGWHFITTIHDLAASGAAQSRLFYDSVEQVQVAAYNALNPGGNHANSTLYVGSRYGGTTLHSAQRMRDLAIFGSALTQADVDAIYKTALRAGVSY